MVKEVWELEITPTSDWKQVYDWLVKCAQAARKREFVVDAYGLRSDTGDAKAFRTAYFVLTFKTLEDRHAYYRQPWNEEQKALVRDNDERKYMAGLGGHWYFEVYA